MTSILDTSLTASERRTSRAIHLDLPRFALAVWGSAGRAGAVSAFGYALVALLFGPYGLGQTKNAYYVYLAGAFLRGQSALAVIPPSTHDLSLYQGHYFLYWPPFPALLFMPFVRAFGTGISDTLITLLVAALNVALVSRLLRELDVQKVVNLPLEKRAWLTAFFAFGTVHVTLAPYGRVWNTGLVVAFALICSAYLAALRLPQRWAPLVTGALVGCAFLSRNSAILAAGWVAWHLWTTRNRSDRLALVKIALKGLAPVAMAVGLQLGYNYLRFGNVLDFGLAYHQMAGRFEADFHRYGAFSLHYLPVNLFYTFVGFPPLAIFGPQPDVDFWMGGSLFLMSPLFLLAIPGIYRWWGRHGWALAVSCVVGLLPALFLMGTGWVEYGPRYTLDITVPLLVATALGASLVSTRSVAVLSLISVAICLPGAMLLGRMMW